MIKEKIFSFMSRESPPLPLPVRRALPRLGADIRDARRRRRLPTAVLANRVGITLPTLRRVERGDPSVSLGIYATVLFVLGLLPKLAAIAAVEGDAVGLALDAERLPQRIRRQRSPVSNSGDNDDKEHDESAPAAAPRGPRKTSGREAGKHEQQQQGSGQSRTRSER